MRAVSTWYKIDGFDVPMLVAAIPGSQSIRFRYPIDVVQCDL